MQANTTRHGGKFSISNYTALDNLQSKMMPLSKDNINNQRNFLRDEEIENIESGNKNYQTSVYYMDVVNELEKMGDFMINISQDLYKSMSKASN